MRVPPAHPPNHRDRSAHTPLHPAPGSLKTRRQSGDKWPEAVPALSPQTPWQRLPSRALVAPKGAPPSKWDPGQRACPGPASGDESFSPGPQQPHPQSCPQGLHPQEQHTEGHEVSDGSWQPCLCVLYRAGCSVRALTPVRRLRLPRNRVSAWPLGRDVWTTKWSPEGSVLAPAWLSLGEGGGLISHTGCS